MFKPKGFFLDRGGFKRLRGLWGNGAPLGRISTSLGAFTLGGGKKKKRGGGSNITRVFGVFTEALLFNKEP